MTPYYKYFPALFCTLSGKFGHVIGSKNKHFTKTLSFSRLEPRLTTLEAVMPLRESPITFEISRTTGYGPRYLKIERSFCYLLSELQVFEQLIRHSSEVYK